MTTSPPSPRAPLRSGLAVALAIAGLSAGCSEGFDPYNRLTSFRVLAIQSDPVAPAPGETTTLRPLFYLPPGDEIASLSWSWCPLSGASTEGYPCLLTEAELAELDGDAPPYDLGTGDTASFEHTLDTDLLASVCAGAAEEPELFDCEGGFPARIRLVARTQAGEEVETVRILRLRYSEEHEANQNPLVEGLRAVVDDEEQAIGSEPTVTLPRNTESVVRAGVLPASIETYTGLDDDGEPERRAEQLILTWFVESGDTKSQRTTFIDGVEPLEDAIENEWEPDGPNDYPPDTSQIIVIVRDDRDGVAWVSGSVALGAKP